MEHELDDAFDDLEPLLRSTECKDDNVRALLCAGCKASLCACCMGHARPIWKQKGTDGESFLEWWLS